MTQRWSIPALLLACSTLMAGDAPPASWQAVGWGGGSFYFSAAWHPTDGNVIYLGSDCAGTFRSDNQGKQWNFTNGGICDYAAYSMAVSPAAPDLVYVLTDGGLCKSTDRAKTWRFIAESGAKALDIRSDRSGSVRAIAIDPAMSDFVSRLLSTTLAATVTSSLAAADPAGGVGSTRIAKWKDERAAAFVLMFDDSTASQMKNVVPELQKRGLTGTFYINPGSGQYAAATKFWEQEVPAAGMEVANHTMTHKGANNLEEANREVIGCNDVIHTITGKLPWPRLVSFGQPGGCPWTVDKGEMQALLDKNHLIKRPDFGGRGAMIAFKTGPEMLAHVDKAISKGAMECIIFHGVGGDWITTPLPVFIELLDGLATRADHLWITGHIPAHQYATERDAATITITERSDKKLRISVTATTDPVWYDQPLTLITTVPATWTACTVTQGKRSADVTATSGSIRYEAVPGSEEVVIARK